MSGEQKEVKEGQHWQKNLTGAAKPYECLQCRAAFKKKCDVIRHIRAVHHGDKPHTCSQCSTSFATKAQVNAHERALHKGSGKADQLRCTFPACDSTFSDHHARLRHYVKSHNSKYGYRATQGTQLPALAQAVLPAGQAGITAPQGQLAGFAPVWANVEQAPAQAQAVPAAGQAGIVAPQGPFPGSLPAGASTQQEPAHAQAVLPAVTAVEIDPRLFSSGSAPVEASIQQAPAQAQADLPAVQAENAAAPLPFEEPAPAEGSSQQAPAQAQEDLPAFPAGLTLDELEAFMGEPWEQVYLPLGPDPHEPEFMNSLDDVVFDTELGPTVTP